MNNKRCIYAIFAVFFVFTITFSMMLVPVSAASVNFYTLDGYLVGARHNHEGVIAYTVDGGGDDAYAYRDGFFDLVSYDKQYTLMGSAYVRGGISSYRLEIWSRIKGENDYKERASIYTATTSGWYSIADGDKKFGISLGLDSDSAINANFSFDIDISDYAYGTDGVLQFRVYAYANNGEQYEVMRILGVSASSADGSGTGDPNIPTEPTNYNWFTSVSQLDCKDGVTIAHNLLNKTFTIDLASHYEPNPTTFVDGTMSISGWCCVPDGTLYYTIDIFNLETGKYITLDTRDQGVSFNVELEDATEDIRNYVTTHGGSTGDYWLNGKYLFNIDFSKLPVDFDDELVTIRIHSISNNGRTSYDLAILSNFYVDFVSEEPPSTPIVNNDNIFNGSTTTVIFKTRNNVEYKAIFTPKDYLFNERSMLNVGDLVSLAYLNLGIASVEEHIKLVTVYIDCPRSYRWRDYNIFVNEPNLIGNDYGQLMGFYALEPNGLYFPIQQDLYDFVVDDDGNRFTRIQLSTVGGTTFSEMVSPFYSDTDDGVYELHIGSVRDTDWFDLFSGIYDAQLETFYGITNFSILGFNISTLLLGLMTLVVVVVIVKKVI